MPLFSGQSLSVYEILSTLGAGAMGEVYRARDTRLDREVAIKVLPAHFVESEERRLRFEREARALACLNHSNVAQIYAVEQVDDTCFIVLELVPGQSLDERIAEGPLAVSDAIDLCRQIAEGMEAAHECGVIHRDLKPANVRVTPDGRAKVLDFGLAKQIRADDTVDIQLTEEGRLLGTPIYMSPEQARGKPVDRRADVWAFGCLFFECLTGACVFGGESFGEVANAILEKEPDWARLPSKTPLEVRALIQRCLEKDPRKRLRDIGEARIALEDLASPNEAPAPVEANRRGVRPGIALLGAIALLGVGLVLGRFTFRAPTAPRELPLIEQRLTELIGIEGTPAISPDGEKVAFVHRVEGKRQIWVRYLADGSSRRLTTGKVDHSFPRWVDENRLIYFVEPEAPETMGSLWETNCFGTSTPKRILTSVDGETDVARTDGRLVMFRSQPTGSSLVAFEYGQTSGETLVDLQASSGYQSLRWSPDAKSIAFERRLSLARFEIQVVDISTKKIRTVARVTGQTRGLAWLPDGSGLIYSSSKGSTLPYPPLFSLRHLDLASEVDVPIPCSGGGYASYVEPDVSAQGKLVVSRVVFESDIYGYPVTDDPSANVENAIRVTYQTGLVQVPAVSPDGQQVAYLSDRGGRANIWVQPVNGGRFEDALCLSQESDVRAIIGLPVWSPRGDWITYWRGPADGFPEQWLVRPGGLDRRQLVKVRGAASWSRDGEWLYFVNASNDPAEFSIGRIRVSSTDGKPELVRENASGWTAGADEDTAFLMESDTSQGLVYKVSPIATGELVKLVDVTARIPLWPNQFALSPNGDFLATPLRDDGTTNLWLISTEDGSLKKVTDFGHRSTLIGRQVSWTGDGKYIFAALMELDADIVLIDGFPAP